MKNKILRILGGSSFLVLMLFMAQGNNNSFSNNETLDNIISLNSAQAEPQIIRICVDPWNVTCAVIKHQDGTTQNIPGTRL